LPLGIEPPVDVIQYMSGSRGTAKTNSAVKHYLSELSAATTEIQEAGGDTGRLMTIFSVKLESTKKITDADVLAGVGQTTEGSIGPLVVTRTQDPNKTHPLRQTEILQAIDVLHGKRFTSHLFQAVVWKHDLKSKPQFCWEAAEGNLTKYSRDVLTLIKRLSTADVEAALTDYRRHMAIISKRKVGVRQARLIADASR
jgi:hypothetical protein